MNENSLWSRAKRAWNAFTNRDPTVRSLDYGPSYYRRPDRTRLTGGNERTIVTSLINQIAIDVAAINIKHVKLDDSGRFISEIDSEFNRCLNLSANLDQTGRALRQDAVMTMFDQGCVALVPTDTEGEDPRYSDNYDITSMRVGIIVEWFPTKVKVRVYNERNGKKEDVILPKTMVSIVENPLYSVINEPNSTYQRLVRKLNLLDIIDEQSGAGKLDLIIQLPYVVKNEMRRQQAEQRRKDIEMQLAGSKYGIAYTDGTEHITQLNRSLDNNLMTQIEYLTSMLYSQLGMSKEVMEGTADESAMLNYNNRTIEPIISAFVDEMKRKFLSRTALSQSQSVMFFKDPFRLVPVSNIAEIADKFTRNEIMTKNEIRQVIGMKPSDDPKADMLLNSNLSQSGEQMEQIYGNGGGEEPIFNDEQNPQNE